MKIAILGTRGIPNRYGGFEQIAENMSIRWEKNGHEVIVYNPNDHPYKEKEWNDIKIKQIYFNENKLGLAGINIFDYLCLKDALNQDYDIVLELGYSAAIYYPSKKKREFKIITNMDGLEWKRSKWNKLIQSFLKYSEKQAVFKSDALIADHPRMQDYFKEHYNAQSYYIPYGAKLIEDPSDAKLNEYNLKPFSYYLLLARLEPENNIEMILDGYIQSKSKEIFIVIGNKTKYGKYLMNKYKTNSQIKFLGPIYVIDTLNSLRYYSKIYFHGHSVGGTNPSLLEAMGCSCYIAAHNNSFNKYVLEDNAFYFNNSYDISKIIETYTETYRKKYIDNNKIKIKNVYNWDKISDKHLEIFKESLLTD